MSFFVFIIFCFFCFLCFFLFFFVFSKIYFYLNKKKQKKQKNGCPPPPKNQRDKNRAKYLELVLHQILEKLKIQAKKTVCMISAISKEIFIQCKLAWKGKHSLTLNFNNSSSNFVRFTRSQSNFVAKRNFWAYGCFIYNWSV